MVTLPQLQSTYTAGGQPGADKWPCNLFELNPYATNTGSNLLSSVVSPSSDQAYLHNIKGEINITNMTNVSTEVNLYLIKWKHSQTNSPFTTLWNSVLTGNAYGQATATGATAVAAPVMTQGNPNFTTYGQNPWNHPAIRKSVRILRKRTKMLNGGSTEKFRFNIAYNRMFSKQELATQYSTADKMAGYTMTWVVIAKSAPVFETVSNTSTPGPVDLGVAMNYNVSVSYPFEKRLYAYRTDSGFVASATSANQLIINDDDVQASVVALT